MKNKKKKKKKSKWKHGTQKANIAFEQTQIRNE